MADTRTGEISAADAGTIDLGDGLRVHRLGYGAMRITGDGIWGPPEDPEECRAVLRSTRDLGIDFIDTADSYGPEVSERLIGETLHPYDDDLVIATKAGLERSGPGEWSPNGDPGHIRSACEGSLRRLKLDSIELYQLHRIDPDVPEEEQFGVLRELLDEGKIRRVGLSEVSVDEIERARETLAITSVQNRYSIGHREWDAVVDHCEREGIAFIPWAPLHTGDLDEDGGPLVEIARRHDATTSQIALAWLLARSPVMLPIPGTSSVAHLEENTAAAGVELSDDEVSRLTDAL